MHHVRRMVQCVDELIVLTLVLKKLPFEHNRNDYRHKPVKTVNEFISLIATECNIPLTFGGRIRTLEEYLRAYATVQTKWR